MFVTSNFDLHAFRFFFIDELTGFEINIFQVNSFSFLPINYSTDYLTCFSPLGNLYEQMQLPEPFGFIFTWFAALPLILFIAQSITNAIVNDFLILKVLFLVSSLLVCFFALDIRHQIWLFVQVKWWLFSGQSRGHVRIVALKTFPSSGLSCQCLVAVKQTKWNVQSMYYILLYFYMYIFHHCWLCII